MKTLSLTIGGFAGVSALLNFMAIVQSIMNHCQIGDPFYWRFVVCFLLSVIICFVCYAVHTWAGSGLDKRERKFDQ